MEIASEKIDMTHFSAPNLKSFTGGGMQVSVFQVIDLYVYACIYICVYAYMYIHVCINMYIYIYMYENFTGGGMLVSVL
jgi:hypothetical protein